MANYPPYQGNYTQQNPTNPSQFSVPLNNTNPLISILQNQSQQSQQQQFQPPLNFQNVLQPQAQAQPQPQQPLHPLQAILSQFSNLGNYPVDLNAVPNILSVLQQQQQQQQQNPGAQQTRTNALPVPAANPSNFQNWNFGGANPSNFANVQNNQMLNTHTNQMQSNQNQSSNQSQTKSNYSNQTSSNSSSNSNMSNNNRNNRNNYSSNSNNSSQNDYDRGNRNLQNNNRNQSSNSSMNNNSSNNNNNNNNDRKRNRFGQTMSSGSGANNNSAITSKSTQPRRDTKSSNSRDTRDSRDSRDNRDNRDSRDSRDRDSRDNRDSRDSRDSRDRDRESRDSRDIRDSRDKDFRDSRDSRDSRDRDSKSTTSSGSSSSSSVSARDDKSKDSESHTKSKKSEDERKLSPTRKFFSRSSTEYKSFVEPQRDYLNIRHRFKKLYVPKDFCKVISSWLHTIPANTFSPHNNVHLNCHKEYTEIAPNNEITNIIKQEIEVTSPPTGVKYSCKIILISGVNKGSTDFCSEMSFVVMRKDKNKLLCLGGDWSKEHDGGDPETDRSVLIKTAIRVMKDLTQLDLTECKQWYEFLEIHYQRPSYREICLVFIPNLSYLSVDFSQCLEILPLKNSPNSIPNTPTDSNTSDENNNIETNHNEITPNEELNVSDDTPTDTTTPVTENEVQEASDQNSTNSTTTPLSPTSLEPQGVETEVFETGKVAFFDHSRIGDIIPDIAPADSTSKNGSSPTSLQNSNITLDLASLNSSTDKTDKVSGSTKLKLTLACPKDVKLDILPLSLNGLLEYDEYDTDDKTFEVSLFGELFHDMLQRDFGNLIYSSLELFSKNNTSMLPGESPLKKLKLEKTNTDYISASTTSEDDSFDDLHIDIGDDKKLEDGEHKRETDYDLLGAFEFFEKRKHKYSDGYLRPEEIENIIHSLGKSLCRRAVEDLVFKVTDPDSGKVEYQKLIKKGLLYSK